MIIELKEIGLKQALRKIDAFEVDENDTVKELATVAYAYEKYKQIIDDYRNGKLNSVLSEEEDLYLQEKIKPKKFNAKKNIQVET